MTWLDPPATRPSPSAKRQTPPAPPRNPFVVTLVVAVGLLAFLAVLELLLAGLYGDVTQNYDFGVRDAHLFRSGLWAVLTAVVGLVLLAVEAVRWQLRELERRLRG